MQVAEYGKKIRNLITAFLTEKNPSATTTHRLSISFSDMTLALLHLNKTAYDNELIYAETFPYTELSAVPLVLTEVAKKNKLQELPTYLLLGPDDYQIFLIESMPVAQDELRDALSWRIRSLINYPIEEALYDYFIIPAKKTSADKPMVAAVVARKGLLKENSDLLKKCGLKLTTIGIPELAMTTLTSFYEHDEKSTAFIYFFKQTAILNITSQQTLFFTRRLNTTLKNLANPKEIEKICLDLLRYFDYFQSQWRYPTPARIFVSTETDEAEGIAKQISDNLLLPVTPYQLKENVIHAGSEKQLSNNLLLTLGCALRG